MEYILKNKFLAELNLEKYNRWFLVLSFSFVVWLKIIEMTSTKLFIMIYSNPSLVEFTKMHESAFWFFI
jgi:hypothetical protein